MRTPLRINIHPPMLPFNPTFPRTITLSLKHVKHTLRIMPPSQQLASANARLAATTRQLASASGSHTNTAQPGNGNTKGAQAALKIKNITLFGAGLMGQFTRGSVVPITLLTCYGVIIRRRDRPSGCADWIQGEHLMSSITHETSKSTRMCPLGYVV